MLLVLLCTVTGDILSGQQYANSISSVRVIKRYIRLVSSRGGLIIAKISALCQRSMFAA